MEEQAKLALGATKTLWKKLDQLEREGGETTNLKELASKANKAVQAIQRLARDEAVCADVRLNIMREAVRDELIDREANAARILDRQRTLTESQREGSAILERSLTSARGIEAAIGALCPHQAHAAPGVAVLANGR